MRAVITGIGVISPIGCGTDCFWEALINGRSGIRTIEGFDTADLPSRIAGQVLDFDPLKFFTKRKLKRMDRFSQMAVAAAQMAWDDAWLNGSKANLKNTGVCIGTGIGGISGCEEAFQASSSKCQKRSMDAFTIPRVMNNAPASNIAMHLGLKGINYTINTACSSGANAIGKAFEYIRSNKNEIILCGGVEAPITPFILKAWSLLRVLSQRNDAPSKACRPFDKERDGFALSEGAGIVVLESLESALRRKADIYAEITGFGSNCDSYHLTAPSLEGEADAIRLAIKDAELKPKDIDYVNAHGTATEINDQVETQAIKKIFGDYAFQTPVSSTKSMTGHAMGASSALEFISTALTVKNDIIPPTINYQNSDPECNLDYVPNHARLKEIKVAISNSFAFGGSNSVLVTKKWKG